MNTHTYSALKRHLQFIQESVQTIGSHARGKSERRGKSRDDCYKHLDYQADDFFLSIAES